MATTATNALSLSSSAARVDPSAALRQPASVSPQCVSLPSLNRVTKITYCRKLARNVAVMATGEVPIAATTAAAPPPPVTDTPASADMSTSTDESTTSSIDSLDTSELLKTIQDTWDKVEDKYAVSSLAVAGVVALCGCAGMISAIDRLPLIPGVLEVVGIGYTGWFVYQNIVYKPEREALVEKIKNTYEDIIGTS